MATALVRNITIDDAKIWRGGSRVIIGDTASPPTFPTKLEDVIDLATMALEVGWTDLGATSDDGVEIERAQDVDEGIAIDQRDTMLRPGRVSGVTMNMSTTLMYTDIATVKKIWEAGTLTAIAASVGVNVAQKKLALGSPTALTNRLVAVLQQSDSDDRLRMFVFRKGKFTETGSIKISAKDTSMVDVTIEFEADVTQTDGTDFGVLFEED
jgi:hypothetical protein